MLTASSYQLTAKGQKQKQKQAEASRSKQKQAEANCQLPTAVSQWLMTETWQEFRLHDSMAA
ncbi:hypothetical protein HF319_08705 [Xanthomonas sp. Kuri4-1]